MPDNNTKASLGCGSLILIAIIVLIFSRGNDDKRMLREIRDTRSQLKEVQAELESQSAILAEIQTELKKLSIRSSTPRGRVLPPQPKPAGE